MAKKRNTGAFVAGSLIGGLAGAALTLWKTPKSGAEMRRTMGFGGASAQPRTMATGDPTAPASAEHRFSNPVLSAVEKLVAPIPGVELGRLAKDDPQATAAAPVRSSAADARPPGSSFDPREPEHGAAMATSETIETGSAERVQPVAGEPLTAPTGATGSTGSETVTYRSGASTSSREPVGQAAVDPAEEATHDPAAGSEAPAASTDDLTSPTPEYVEELQEQRSAEPVRDGSADFPESPYRDAATTEREPVGQAAVNPEEEATHDPEEGTEAPAATTEDLTHPTPEYLEKLDASDGEPIEDGSADFPEPPRDSAR